MSAIAEELLKTEYDVVRIIFNRFQSAISFKPTIATVLSPDALEKEVEAGGNLDQYETEGPDRAEMLQDLAEFQLAAVSCCCLGAVPCMRKRWVMSLISADLRPGRPRIAAEVHLAAPRLLVCPVHACPMSRMYVMFVQSKVHGARIPHGTQYALYQGVI